MAYICYGFRVSRLLVCSAGLIEHVTIRVTHKSETMDAFHRTVPQSYIIYEYESYYQTDATSHRDPQEYGDSPVWEEARAA